MGKNELTIKYLYHENISYAEWAAIFPNRRPLSYLNLTKNMKTYIRCQQQKKKFKNIKTKNERTTTEVSPWKDQ